MLLTKQSNDRALITRKILENKETKLVMNIDFELTDCSFLNGNQFLEKIEVNSQKKVDISFINSLPKIKEVYGQHCILDFEISNKNIQRIAGKWKKGFYITLECENLRNVDIALCKDVKSLLTNVSQLPNVSEFSLMKSNISDFTDLCKLTKITDLSIFYSTNLTSFTNIEHVFPNLKALEIQYSKNIVDYTSIGKLSKLEKLVIFKNGKIDDLEFCKTLTKLTDLRIVSTKIINKPSKDLLNLFSGYKCLSFYEN